MSTISKAYIALVCLFLVAPMLVIVPLSLTSGTMLILPTPGFSLRWYEEVLSSAAWANAFRNSMIVGTFSATFSTVLGTLAAIGTAHSNSRLVKMVTPLFLVPMVLPVVILAVALYYAFASVGLAQTYLGMILAHTVLGTPFVFVMVTAALKSLDVTLIRAGLALGSNPVRVFRTITFPLIAPGMLTGALFAFAASFDELIIVIFMASPTQRTLPREIFAGIQDNVSPAIAAVGVLMMILSTLLMVSSELLRRRTERFRSAGGVS